MTYTVKIGKADVEVVRREFGYNVTHHFVRLTTGEWPSDAALIDGLSDYPFGGSVVNIDRATKRVSTNGAD